MLVGPFNPKLNQILSCSSSASKVLYKAFVLSLYFSRLSFSCASGKLCFVNVAFPVYCKTRSGSLPKISYVSVRSQFANMCGQLVGGGGGKGAVNLGVIEGEGGG